MVSYVIYSIYIYNIYILYIYIYIYMYICVYIGLWRVQIWENPISGQFFSCFFGPLTPPNTFDQGYLGLFCSPGVVWHFSNQPKVWCHILIWIWKDLVISLTLKSALYPFPGSFFLVFLIPWPPLTYLIKAIWVFYVPLELCDILVINKKFGVIY